MPLESSLKSGNDTSADNFRSPEMLAFIESGSGFVNQGSALFVDSVDLSRQVWIIQGPKYIPISYYY